MKAVFLGRFQPFHEGHFRVVEEYSSRFEEFSLAIGSARKSRTQENPLTFEEREELIRQCFPDIKLAAVEDTERTEEGNRKWAERLEEKLDADTVISGNELVQRLVSEHTGMEAKEQEMYDPEIYSGTELRRRIRSGEEWRYLVPGCAEENLEELLGEIRESGIDYEYEPGWKKENASHGTSET